MATVEFRPSRVPILSSQESSRLWNVCCRAKCSTKRKPPRPRPDFVPAFSFFRLEVPIPCRWFISPLLLHKLRRGAKQGLRPRMPGKAFLEQETHAGKMAHCRKFCGVPCDLLWNYLAVD